MWLPFSAWAEGIPCDGRGTMNLRRSIGRTLFVWGSAALIVLLGTAAAPVSRGVGKAGTSATASIELRIEKQVSALVVGGSANLVSESLPGTPNTVRVMVSSNFPAEVLSFLTDRAWLDSGNLKISQEYFPSKAERLVLTEDGFSRVISYRSTDGGVLVITVAPIP